MTLVNKHCVCLQAAVATAIWHMESGLFRLVAKGVHPLHHTCLDIYTCLASACRMHARGNTEGGPHVPAVHARAALYTLMLANGLKQLLDTGACST